MNNFQKKYSILKLLENGLQSSVYLAKDNDTQKNVAIKSFHYNHNNTGSKEFSILSNLLLIF